MVERPRLSRDNAGERELSVAQVYEHLDYQALLVCPTRQYRPAARADTFRALRLGPSFETETSLSWTPNSWDDDGVTLNPKWRNLTNHPDSGTKGVE